MGNRIFFKESKSKKKGKKKIFLFYVLGRGLGVVSEFLQRMEINTFFFIFFFLGGGGGGSRNGRGSVARGSVARVSDFFLQIIQI